MQGVIKDVQKESFQNLINTVIPDIISNTKETFGDYEFSAKPMFAGNSIVLIDQTGTEYYSIKADCMLRNTVTGEKVEFDVELLRVPVLQELGFKIKGNYMQQLDVYERATGWNFYSDKNAGECAALIAGNKRSIYFNRTSKGPSIRFLLHGENKKAKIRISTFFRAIAEKSNEELISQFGYNNPFVIEAFGAYGDNRSIDECIRDVAAAVLNNGKVEDSTVLNLKRSIETDLFTSQYFPLGDSNAERLNHFQSFSYRANGRSLVKPINCNGYYFDSGMILSEKELQVIDKLPISEMDVEYNGKIYHLQKFSTFTFDALGCRLNEDIEEFGLKKGQRLTEGDIDRLNSSNLLSIVVDNNRQVTRRRYANALCLEDLLTTFSIWADNLNGYDQHSKQFEISNRVLISYDKKIAGLIYGALQKVIHNVRHSVDGMDYSGQLVACINECYKDINVNAFIDSVANASNNAGQMSDMCNLLAYVSKSSKATASMGKASSTDEMVNVQDLQEGRLDPLDVPESDKIGTVHYRAILSKLSEDGSPTAPYLRVVNGEVVSEEPVYLTALEETGVYIAEWNETFRNEDGSMKDRVRTRCNGNVQTVELNRVTYKEYSPYQNFSPAHSMVPFPGHSNGKRITMACNQVKQAVPCVNRERPIVIAGGESMLGIGVYTARDILEDYYGKNHHLIVESKETVLGSDLRLHNIHKGNEQRTFTFTVEAVSSGSNEASIVLPYHVRTYEAAMFSYDINPKADNVYRGDDVVLYNNGYSLEAKPLAKCADFGAQKVEDGVFDKGVALVQNLNVVYKTYGGSVIEDGILISSKLVYDDSLTHIGMFEIKDVASSSKELTETFRLTLDESPEYMLSNGLPAVGTYLKPGMRAISKIISTPETDTVRYTKVPKYVEGQVIYAGLETTLKGIEAKVIVAQRSYVQSGDKMAGRCGNKGVIARIVPETEMPFREDTGEAADVVLSPLGVPSRMNITQLLEIVLGYCMKLEGKMALVTPYNPKDVDFVRKLAEQDGVGPSVMIDGRTGRRFDRPMNFGVLPMYKLHHVAKRKIHAVGMNAKLDSTFLQPTKGSKQNGGQSFGEMEAWCLESVGATTLLNELFTVQSDDAVTRNEMVSQQNLGGQAKTVNGQNGNDLAMQACYRSLGVEFKTNAEEGCYTFEPLTDEIIKSLHHTPITSKSMLHAEFIFGERNSLTEKLAGRDKWGWIDLHTRTILPIWIYKGGLPVILGLSADKMKNVIQCEGYLRVAGGNNFNYCTKSELEEMKEEKQKEYETGMPALVKLFETYDTVIREIEAKASYESYMTEHSGAYDSDKATKMRKVYRALRDFNASGHSLADYVVSAFPVMPQTYRPEVKIAGRNTTPDFDWFYTQIIYVANLLEKDNSVTIQRDLFNAILEFTGLDDHVKNKTYKSLLTFFCAKGQKNHHGKIRENMQSKRILCSGRCAIKPAEDTRRTPLELGVPFTMMVEMYAEQLYGYFCYEANSKNLNRNKFDKLMLYLSLRDKSRFLALYEKSFKAAFDVPVSTAYDEFTEKTKAYLEGRNGNPVKAVGAGRQPSLHKYSIRAFKPYVVYDYVVHLHPLLCNGYNADFDGDQMYVYAIMSLDAIEEALDKLSPAKDFILPKNGSVALEHSQDIVLGVYCATMLENNALQTTQTARDLRYYSNAGSMCADYETGLLRMSDLVVYKAGNGEQYLSTAGRIIFNCIIPGGFTKQPFRNVNRIAGVKPELYKDLRYDGIVGSGSGNGAIDYYKLSAICKTVYEECPLKAIEVYQAITEFGFLVSDKTGISINLQDLDVVSNKEVLLEEAETVKHKVEQDYQDGLISEKDKRNAVIAIYGDKTNGVNEKIMKDIIDNLPRDNNIFIMMDSGARGNKSQIMQMCGAVGTLQKTKTEDLETSVTRNYYDGLNSFDVHLASYSARTGVASTQNETKRSGYATHKVVYMTSGIQVVENDCGCGETPFTIEWEDHLEEKDRFMPTKEWFDEHLLGQEVDQDVTDGIRIDDDGIITEKSYERLKAMDGFGKLNLRSGVIQASILCAKGEVVVDMESRKLLRFMPKKYKLDMQSIDILLKRHLGRIETENGVYSLRYSMSSSCKSLMTKRVAYGLPYLRYVYDKHTGKYEGIITDRTIEFVEENKIDVIRMRTTLRCRSKYGICAHCFGLTFSEDTFPEIGSFVGTESAQSIAEPASQLTMDVINKGGAAGSSRVSSGVQVFEDLLGGLKQDDRMTAIAAPNSGYLKVEKIDNLATVSIMPYDETSQVCRECLKANKMMSCPGNTMGGRKALCMMAKRIPYNALLHRDGEWVNAGERLTNDMLHPDNVVNIGDNSSPEELHVYKQRIWINNYYNIFKDSGISIYARHFELIANVQNKYVRVLDPGDTDLELGKVYEFNEVRDVINKTVTEQFVSKRSDVVLRNSGALAALSFENVASIAANLVVTGHKEYANRNHSLISSLAVGEDLRDRRVKKLNAPVIRQFIEPPKSQEVHSQELSIVEVKTETETPFSLAGFDFEALTASITAFDDEKETVSESKLTVPDEASFDEALFDDFAFDDEEQTGMVSDTENLQKQNKNTSKNYKEMTGKSVSAF